MLFVVWIVFWLLVVDPFLAALHPAFVERTVMTPGEGMASPSAFLAALTFALLLVVLGWVTGHRSMSDDVRLFTSAVYGRNESRENDRS